jgi:uncharacterized protein (TIGR03067 family)
MTAMTCPSRQELSDYVLGRLSDEASEGVAEHLESCGSCQAGLATFDDADDTLVARLRLPAEDDPYQGESQCRVAVARARAVGGRGSLPAPEPEAAASHSEVLGTLGEYQLLEKLGHGGMGTVYRAVHTKLDRVVALKVLPKGRADDQQAIARFEREMKAIGRLDHPNIVRAYDAREIEGKPVLIMEYVEGLDLGKLVRRLGPLAVADACELARQAALGLEYAHENGLVHRDVKPSNLMLTPEGDVKILDLGLARFHREQAAGEEMTGTGQAMGTADYMAPEQASDSHAVDIRADIYSLGCTLYKLLTGRAPFGGPEYKGSFEKMTAHVQEPVPPIREFDPEIPENLAAVLDRMLAKEPDERFATPQEVAEALKPFCIDCELPGLLVRAEEAKAAAAEVPSPALPCPGPAGAAESPPTPLPFWRRGRLLAAAIGLMLLSLGGGIALGIIITIHRNGKTTSVELPEGSTARLDNTGNLSVTPPDEAGKPVPATAKSDFEAIQGTWELELMVNRGRRVPKEEEAIRGMRVVIQGDRFVILRTWLGQKLSCEYRLRLDPRTSPNRMDWVTLPSPTASWGGLRLGLVVVEGIYELEGDRLRICQDASGGGRPTHFPSAPYGPNDILAVLKYVGPVPEKFPPPPRPGSAAHPDPVPPGVVWAQSSAPTPGGAEPVKPSEVIDIQVDKSGEVRLDGRQVGVDPSAPWLAELRQRVAGGVGVRVEVRCDPAVAYRHVAALTEALQAAGVKRVSICGAESTVRPTVTPAQLNLRIAPTRVGRGKPAIDQAEINRYSQELQAKGPKAGRNSGAPFAWFELKADAEENLITANYQGSRYVLLATTPDDVMLAEDEGQRAWRLLSVGLSASPLGFRDLFISLRMDRAGEDRLFVLTATHLGQPLAILLDDQVVSARSITSKFNLAAIHGRFDNQELQRMFFALQAGIFERRFAALEGPEKPSHSPEQPTEGKSQDQPKTKGAD